MAINNVTLLGRLTRDPELRYTQQNTPVCSFTLAVDRASKDDACDFVDCVAWSGTAEFVSKYFTKGAMLALVGRLQVRQYEKDGQKRTAVDVVAERVSFAGEKREAQPQYPAPAVQQNPAYAKPQNPQYQKPAYPTAAPTWAPIPTTQQYQFPQQTLTPQALVQTAAPTAPAQGYMEPLPPPPSEDDLPF